MTKTVEKKIRVYLKQGKFLQSKALLRAFVGGIGCIDGATVIGGVPVAEQVGHLKVRTFLDDSQTALAFCKGRSDLYQVTTQSGRDVKVTVAHRFLTPGGWLPLSRLGIDSLIAADGGEDDSIPLEKSISLMDDCCSRLRPYGELRTPLEAFLLDRERQYDGQAYGIHDPISFCHLSTAYSVRHGRGFPLGPLSVYHASLNDDELFPYTNAFWDRIQDIKFVRHGDFYDLNVPFGNHYSANGLWHHNSGKSYIGALDMILKSKPGRLYLVTAPTYSMLSDASFRTFQNLARQLELAGDVKTSPPPDIKLRNGAEILFRSTDNPETLRGPNLSGIWMDEASLSKQEAFDILIGRLREGGEQGWLTATFTPKGKVHWTYKTFATEQPDTELIHATSEENWYLPPDFVAKLHKRYTMQQAKQELGGAFLEGAGNHYFPALWPRYLDTGDAYRVSDGGGRTKHIRKAECSRLLTLDWAMGKPKSDARSKAAAAMGLEVELKGDCTAFLVADMAPDGILFLLWCLNERIPMGSNAPRLAEVCRRFHPAVVAGDDDNLSETMLLETRRYRDIPLVKPMAIGGRNKLVRSQAAIVRAERGMVYLPSDVYHASAYGQRFDGQVVSEDWVDMLSDQLSAFTGADGEPDDIADAMGLMGRLADEFVPGEDGDGYDPEGCIGGYDPMGGDTGLW